MSACHNKYTTCKTHTSHVSSSQPLHWAGIGSISFVLSSMRTVLLTHSIPFTIVLMASSHSVYDRGMRCAPEDNECALGYFYCIYLFNKNEHATLASLFSTERISAVGAGTTEANLKRHRKIIDGFSREV